MRVASEFDDVSPLGEGRLSEAQSGLLAGLDAAGGRLTLRAGEITTTDIAALTLHRQTEYALVRIAGGRRQLVELGSLVGWEVGCRTKPRD